MKILFFILFFIFNIYFNFLFDKYILKKFCLKNGCDNVYCKDFKICPFSKYTLKNYNIKK